MSRWWVGRQGAAATGQASVTAEDEPLDFCPRNPEDTAGTLLTAKQVQQRQETATRHQLQHLYASPDFVSWRRRKFQHDVKHKWIPRIFIGLAILFLASGASSILVRRC